MLKRAALASRIFLIAGVVLVVVGIIHLAVTPAVYAWFAPTIKRGLSLVGPAMVLNHVVVGVLLLPLGLNTIIASRRIGGPDRAYWAMLCVSTAAVCVLPLLLVILMRGPDYTAVLFRVAEALVTLAAATMVFGLVISRRSGP